MPNLAPSGSDNTLSADRGVRYTFYLNDFGFFDPDFNNFYQVIVTTLPTDGVITIGTDPVTSDGYIINADQIALGIVRFTSFNEGSANFTFQVVDDGGTLEGGEDTDPTPNTFTFNVGPNDPPTLANFNATSASTATSNEWRLIDSDVSIFDPDFDAIGDYNGLTVTASITGGNGHEFAFDVAHANSLGFPATFTLTEDVSGEFNILYNGVLIATYPSNSHAIAIAFTNDALQINRTLVDAVVGSLAYRNTNAIPLANVTISYTVADGYNTTDGGSVLLTYPTHIIDVTPGTYWNPAGDVVTFYMNAPLNEAGLFDSISSNHPSVSNLIMPEDTNVGYDETDGFVVRASTPISVIETWNGHDYVILTPPDNENVLNVHAAVLGDGNDTFELTFLNSSGGSTFITTFATLNELDGGAGVDTLRVRGYVQDPGGLLNGIPGPPKVTNIEIIQFVAQSTYVEMWRKHNVLRLDASSLAVLPGLTVNFSEPGVDTDDQLWVYGGYQGGTIDLRGVTFNNVGYFLDTNFVQRIDNTQIWGSNTADVIYANEAVAARVLGFDGNDTLVGSNLDVAGYEIDYLDGGAGNDTVRGLGGNDALIGGTGNDRLLGGAGNDSLYGADLSIVDVGNDTLDGGAGGDFMVGGRGNDTYYVDSLFDSVIESLDEGSDRVITTLASYILVSNVERLSYNGAVAPSGLTFAGIGNALGNRIDGSAGNDLLMGVGGADSLFGLGGDDTLDGGEGADVMRGGAGNDVYVIDDVGDIVTEVAGEGDADAVYTTLSSYSLRPNFEVLVYTGDSAFAGIGNALDNDIYGGIGNDTLNGLAGADTMAGLAGDDTYIVDSRFDVIEEAPNGGYDRAIIVDGFFGTGSILNFFNMPANLERASFGASVVPTSSFAFACIGNGLDNRIDGSLGRDSLAGLGGNDTLFGNGGNDLLYGGAGDDVIYGGPGADVIEGGSGFDRLFGNASTVPDLEPDIFSFFNLAESTATAAGSDIIYGFATGTDKIGLYMAPNDTAFRGTGAFVFDPGQAQVRTAQVSPAFHLVYLDIDGNTTTDMVIRLAGVHTPVAGDFIFG